MIAPADLAANPDLMTAPEVAALLRVSLSFLAKERTAGRGPDPVQVGPRCYRWHRSEVLSWLKARNRPKATR